MGFSSVRRQEIHRTTDLDEDDDLEPTTMAPLASQVIAAMMNDAGLEPQPEKRPSGFRVKDPAPATEDDQATVPLTAAIVQEAIARVEARAQARAEPVAAGVPRPMKIDATEIAIFVLAFSATAAVLAYTLLP